MERAVPRGRTHVGLNTTFNMPGWGKGAMIWVLRRSFRRTLRRAMADIE